ncbi:serine/threonine-protein kinase pim-1-like [Eucyclogobius newberryi]|uniref:serine/threonine-protein kinase pim-1-like n=1 Tax=Eucyclogobius newberryi TaxID=166745 RepID=UPI003B5AB403
MFQLDSWTGYGSVFEGVRLEDRFRVAIKHIACDKVNHTKVVQNGVEYNLIEEVALMVKVAHCPAVVPLLDCYEFPEEVVIVMERPYPALDLLEYKKARGGVLKEKDAKRILRQLVEASIQMHKSGVFHRNLNLKNVLVEIGDRSHKAMIIDFGCGCLATEGTYTAYAGTLRYVPPEMYSSKVYRAEPTTVYHLGAILHDLLYHKPFDTSCYLKRKSQFSIGRSKECQDFLNSCLAKDPSTRPSFEELQRHPWFL